MARSVNGAHRSQVIKNDHALDGTRRERWSLRIVPTYLDEPLASARHHDPVEHVEIANVRYIDEPL